jgi:hypothetical protein
MVAAGCGFADPGPGDEFPVEATAVIDRAVRAHMEAGLIPGAAVAIVDPERGRYLRAYGLADTTNRRPATVDDHFRIGSVTKTFTATAVLRRGAGPVVAGRFPVDRMASFQAQFSLQVNVDRVTLIRPNILLATTSTTSSVGRMPLVVPLVPRDGKWWLPTWWVCAAAGPPGPRLGGLPMMKPRSAGAATGCLPPAQRHSGSRFPVV